MEVDSEGCCHGVYVLFVVGFVLGVCGRGVGWLLAIYCYTNVSTIQPCYVHSRTPLSISDGELCNDIDL